MAGTAWRPPGTAASMAYVTGSQDRPFPAPTYFLLQEQASRARSMTFGIQAPSYSRQRACCPWDFMKAALPPPGWNSCSSFSPRPTVSVPSRISGCCSSLSWCCWCESDAQPWAPQSSACFVQCSPYVGCSGPYHPPTPPQAKSTEVLCPGLTAPALLPVWVGPNSGGEHGKKEEVN